MSLNGAHAGHPQVYHIKIFLGYRSHGMKIISRPGMLSKNSSTNGDNWNPG
jgi:hypothetical protein